jgi:hypothetical protein
MRCSGAALLAPQRAQLGGGGVQVVVRTLYALAMLACSVICFNALQQPPW